MQFPENLQVLIVEDNTEFADMLQAMLRHVGIAPQRAASGEAALQMVAQQRPDVMLLDLNLGGMSGWQVLEKVREDAAQKHVAVIVTTAFSDAANRVMGKLQEIDRYLIKPFTPQQLYDAIETVINAGKLSL